MQGNLGRYKILEELGQGAMGIVYKARDPLIGRLVAIKTVNLKILPEAEKAAYGARFYQEAKAAGHLNHPNIVTIHDLGETGDVAYIAMELMEGRKLQDILNGEKRMSPEQALNIAIQVAAGLNYAHKRGIVHRDIKPSNIMVTGDNHVKIADFGIASMASSLKLTHPGMIVGSPLYMSPEQILGKTIDARSDIFSLGVTLYQLLAWQLPFFAENADALMHKIVTDDPPPVRSLSPDVPEALDAIVSRCLAKDPDARYQTAGELVDDLNACREDLLRARVGLDHPFTMGAYFRQLKHLAIPGGVPQNLAAILGYLAILLIFAFDMITDSTIQIHMLYVLPLIMISFHCDRIKLVYAAVIMALVLQVVHLTADPALSVFSRFILTALIFSSNILLSYVSRIARTNLLEIGHLAAFDTLTGLPNRTSFESILSTEITQRRNLGGVFSFALIALANFNEFNDSRGREAGDEILKRITGVMLEHVRKPGTVARLGGVEFALLMPDVGEKECELLCERLKVAISGVLEESSFSVPAKVGYTTFDHAPASLSEIYEKAHIALSLSDTNARGYVFSDLP